MFTNNNGPMHAQDKRNLFIFIALAGLLYLSYDAFVLKPQMAQMRAQQQAVAKQQTSIDGPEVKQQAQVQEFVSREEALSADTARITIENAELHGSLSLRGGIIDDMALKQYYETLEAKENVVLLAPKGTEHARYFNFGWVAGDKNIAVPDENSRWSVHGNNRLAPGKAVTLVWSNGQGLSFEKRFEIDESFVITVNQGVVNNSGNSVTLYPYGLVSQTGTVLSRSQSWLQHEGPIGYIGEELHEVGYKDLRKDGAQDYAASDGWIGITDKYWLTGVIPAQGVQTKFRFSHSSAASVKNEEGKLGEVHRYQTDFTGAALSVAPGQAVDVTNHIFVGAKRVLQLEEYEEQLSIPHFNLAVNFGWFWFLSKPFFYALHYLGQLTGNFGVAIIMLTVLIRSAVFPLTNASYKSFAKMKKVTPQVSEIRSKYGDDKQKLQQELVKMYEREGVNPMAGCLPMLLQIPIFFALYKVLFVTIEMRHAPFFGWIQDLSAPDPTSVFNLFGLIDWTPPSFLHIGVWPCLMLVMMVMQRKLNPPPQDPIQRDMANYFPFIMAFMMSKFAAGLVIYWTFSAFISVLQQMIIMRSMNVPIYIFGQYPDEKKLNKQIAEGPSVHPELEMLEDDVEDALFGDEKSSAQKEIKPPKPKRSKKKK